MDYFVMLNTQNGSFTPLMDEKGDDIAKFATDDDADKMAAQNPMGEHFGYEVFQIGMGL